ncbi:MAG: hypothetical protein IPI01_12110 [Ignavibacteriae bacterium]|nr:hypothetical protein [Ignavibacteriota bacterium]
MLSDRMLRAMVLGGLVAVMVPGMGSANERRFGYVYETPVLSPGARELEVWNTYRSGKAYSFRRLDQRIELEFGVAERLMTAFYLNYEWKAGDANGSAPGGGRTTEQSASISNEWKYKVLDRVADPLGLALYGEYTLGLYERELEFKVILDKQLGRFLLAGNLVGEQEWEDELEDGVLETENELKFEVSGGVSYSMSAHFSLGLEVVEWNVLKEGRIEHAVLFAGPVLSYATEEWWATLSVLPQVTAFKGATMDGLDLEESERAQVRLLVSFHL